MRRKWLYFYAVRERNRLKRGGASAHKKAYQAGCALPVNELNTVEIGKQQEEKCNNINEDKKNTGQNLEDYLELKDGKKIQVLNECQFQMD